MTTDQLERDLTSLAEPHADDDRLRLSIRATLREQVRPAPRRRTRLAFGFGAIAAATVAAAIVALIGTGGSSDAAILAHVVHASSPPANLVVHLKETGTQPDGTQVSAEWWQETNAPYAMRLIKGEPDLDAWDLALVREWIGEGGSDQIRRTRARSIKAPLRWVTEEEITDASWYRRLKLPSYTINSALPPERVAKDVLSRS